MAKTVFFVMLVLALPGAAQVRENPRTLGVSGEATVMVAPDQAVVTIGVETFNASLEEASAANDRIARTLIAEWKKLDIADANILTSGLTVEIRYDDHRARVVEGYVVRRSYDVTASSAAVAEKVVSRGLASGANQVGRIDFRSTQMRKYRDEARVNAVKAAREKAALLAREFGVSVGAPTSITETTSHYGYNYGGATQMSQNVMSYAPDGNDSDSSGAVAPGQLAVRASVSVTFELIAKQ